MAPALTTDLAETLPASTRGGAGHLRGLGRGEVPGHRTPSGRRPALIGVEETHRAGGPTTGQPKSWAATTRGLYLGTWSAPSQWCNRPRSLRAGFCLSPARGAGRGMRGAGMT